MEQETEPYVEKIPNTMPDNIIFNQVYNVYSVAYDKASPEIRLKLNRIKRLFDSGKISKEEFYQQIDPYRKDLAENSFWRYTPNLPATRIDRGIYGRREWQARRLEGGRRRRSRKSK